jgi:cytidylate kinase
MEAIVAVIAMTREMGTHGRDVAAGLAEQMGLKVIHHELVEHDLAQRMEVEESLVHRFLEGGASPFERWRVDRKRMSRLTAQELFELARQGNVLIRGWGATVLLQPVQHVVCVRVCAPMEFRERVMMERLGITDRDVVRREIELNDAAHSRTIQGFFGVDWRDPLLYDIVLNTGLVPVMTCVQLVRLLADSPEYQETEESRGVLEDKLLEARVRAVLLDHFGFGMGVSGIEVTAEKGKVTLRGAAIHRELIADAEKLVRAVEGVKEVDDRITVVPTHLRHH